MNIQTSAIATARFAYRVLRNAGQQYGPILGVSSRANSCMLTKCRPYDLLKPTSFTIVPANGMMTKWRVAKLCQYCYFVWRQSVKCVYCKKHPSHNQQTYQPRSKERFIITQKSESRIRPW